MSSSTTSNHALRSARALSGKTLQGQISVPGDKSISHRALMLSSQALGLTTISGLLEGEDVLRTAEALRQCGVPLERRSDGIWTVKGLGIGGLHQPTGTLDMGNAGTAARLLMGLLAPYPYTVQFTGDESLSKRPMQRVITPLSKMGAEFMARDGGRLPLSMRGSQDLRPIDYALPVASAQVKSAILLAALNTKGITTVIEKEATRDHTERMLRFFGIAIQSQSNVITLAGQQKQTFKNRSVAVPADPSSAAFPLVAALITPGSEVTVLNVCLNPLRIGLLTTLMEMGGDITIANAREVGGEPVGDITAKYSSLQGVEVSPERAPSMIDEYPILAVAAAYADGRSIMRGLSELRVKESDRLAAIIAGLHDCGVEAVEEGDNLIVFGRGRKHVQGGATVTTHYDHRIAMSFLILGLASQEAVIVDDIRAIATSFPDFMPLMRSLGAEIWEERRKIPRASRKLVVAVDGPAASGKGTLARRLADHYGLAYLDTGSLYRAAGMRLIYANKEPNDIAAAIAAAEAIQEHDLNNPKLRGERVGQAASIVSAIPEVREALLDYQHKFAMREGGAVLDGRDIGTVVCPKADVKLFITASIDTRAKRRHRQLESFGYGVDYESVVEDLKERDARDAARSIAPLKAAPDAIILDTSDMSANEVFDRALELVEARLNKA